MSATDPAVGSAAQEAARLLESLGGWFTPSADAPDAPEASGAPEPVAAAHDPASCRVCPVCRGIDAVRAVRPEVIEHLASAAESLAAALRELTRPAGDAPGEPRARQPAPTPVRIPVRDDDAPDADERLDDARLDDTSADGTGPDVADHPTTHHRSERGRDEQDGAGAWG